MIILKIQDKGMMVDIPGTKKVRSPAEIDITNVDINFVTMYLRKQGIKNYRIISGRGKKEVLPTGSTKPKKKKGDKNDGKRNEGNSIESRFNELESLIISFLGKKQNKPTANSEQITKEGGPKIEELDDTFIPAIDIEGMTMKGSTIKTLQSDSDDADEAADLLSSIVKNGG